MNLKDFYDSFSKVEIILVLIAIVTGCLCLSVCYHYDSEITKPTYTDAAMVEPPTDCSAETTTNADVIISTRETFESEGYYSDGIITDDDGNLYDADFGTFDARVSIVYDTCKTTNREDDIPIKVIPLN